MSRARTIPSLLLLLGLLLGTGELRAEVRRYAVIVGNNAGDASDVHLQFAEADAAEMSDLLQSYGGIAAHDVRLLVGQDADTVRRELILLNDELRRTASDPTVDTLLFVFYSGHADAQALHLGGSRLDLEELRRLVSGSAARMRVLVLDACQSGALTGVKGSQPAPPFAIDLDDRLSGEGVAFITSSTAGELSQESSDLGASFFAHYFMVGLRGVADTSGDGKVTLLEAYGYAAQRTLRATSRTMVGPQHPTYEYDIRGRADVTLTDLTRDRGRQAMLVFETPGEYLVFRADDGPLVAEVATSRPNRRLAVSPGRYLVRLRSPAELRDVELFADAGREVPIRVAGMEAVAYQKLLPKGGFSRGRRHGPTATVHYRGETLNSLGGMVMGGVSYPLVFGRFWLQPRLLIGGSSFRGGDLSLRQLELDGELLLSYGLDLRHVVLLFGGGVGGMYLRQDASESSGLGGRSSAGFLMSAHISGVVPIDAGFFMSVDAEALAVVMRRFAGAGESVGVEPTFRVGFGLGYSL